MAIVFDIETNGLLDDAHTVHCIATYDTETGNKQLYDAANLPILMGIKYLAAAEVLVGHNVIGFDLPVLEKLYNFKTDATIYDTLVAARLAWADRKNLDYGLWRKQILPGNLIGRHSLESYGYRLGVLKGTYGSTTDWQTWTPEMSEYCELDVHVTTKLFFALGEAQLPAAALKTEHAVQRIIHRQHRYGFYFDIDKAEMLYADLLSKRTKLKYKLRETFPPFYIKGKEFTPKRDNKARGYVAGATMTKISQVHFNPASGQHIASQLIKRYGWVPADFTEKSGEAKVDEDVLSKLDYPEAKLLVEYMMLNKRVGQIAEGQKAWLKMFNSKTHRIHGSVNSCGTNTNRMTHFNPNVAQTPAKHVPYGPECRDCWTVPSNKRLVGADAMGLELRCLAHYMAPYDGGAYGEAVVHGNKKDKTDAHNMVAKSIGKTRDKAKTWFYGWLYGAGNTLLGDGNAKEGKRLRNLLLSNMPALDDLIRDVQKASKRGYLKAIDGRKLRVRNEYSALNVLLQGTGAVLMKVALVVLENNLLATGYVPGKDYEFVANIHDEWQIECDPGPADRIGRMACNAIKEAGEKLGFRIPMDGDYAVGKSWKETH